MPRPTRCVSCGAPSGARDASCSACGGTLPSRLLDDDVRAAAEALLRGADGELSGASGPLMMVEMLLLFGVPVAVLVWGGHAGMGILVRLMVAVAFVVFALVGIGVTLDGVRDRLFESRLRARLLAFVEEEGLEKSELLALAARLLPPKAPLNLQLTKL